MTSLYLNPNDQQILCDRFNKQLEYVKKHFLFYQEFYKEFIDFQLDTLNDLPVLPYIDKQVETISVLIDEVLSKHPPAYFETSGTSGNPFPVIPDLGPERGGEFADFIFNWIGLDKTEVKRALIALPFEMNPIGLKYFNGLIKAGIMAIPVGVKTLLCPPKKVIELMCRLQPELLIGRPLESMRYALAMQDLGLNPHESSIKKIILTGEIISKSKYKKISELYGGIDVHGVYGLTELDSGGLVSCSHYNYHIPRNPYLIVELLKDDYKTPVQEPGELGHLFLTNTQCNFMPLLRYRTGDYGTFSLTCGCGNPNPVINILGRAADRIDCPSTGCMVFPIQIEEILYQFQEIGSDYQLISEMGSVLLKVETTTNKTAEEQKVLAKAILQKVRAETGLEFITIEIFNPNELADRLGIAKSKAGTLYHADGLDKNKLQDLSGDQLFKIVN